jgi:predicted Zn-ribbon and HTH transcriptional regulator
VKDDETAFRDQPVRTQDFSGSDVIPGTLWPMGDRRTLRQQIASRLAEAEVPFDELRVELGLTVRDLEEHLRHVARSVRAGGRSLRVGPARCIACGFVFSRGALHPPGRCPECRERRIEGPWLSIV